MSYSENTIIVANNDDGHCYVFPFNKDTIRDLLKAVIEGNEYNTILDEPEEAQMLLDNNATMDEMAEFLDGEVTGRSNGAMIYFVELGDRIPSNILFG